MGKLELIHRGTEEVGGEREELTAQIESGEVGHTVAGRRAT